MWMAAHRLKLNDSKTELMVDFCKSYMSNPYLFGNEEIYCASVVRNQGVLFNPKRSMEPHINKVCKTGYWHLSNLSRLRHCMSADSMIILINAFIHSHIENCNSLLYNLPNKLIMKLQKLNNAAARLITNSDRTSSSTELSKTLHWLPVHFRIDFKIVTTVYRCLHGQAPEYLFQLLKRK